MKTSILAAIAVSTAMLVVPGLGTAGVIVSFSSTDLTFVSGQTLNIELLADISDPVLGYGIDVLFDSTKLTLSDFTQGPLWFSIAGSEPDEVAGIAFPNAVSGSGVLLGTLSLTANVSGSTALSAGYYSTNLAEGFPLATGGFATSNLIDLAAQSPPPAFVSPEPATIGLVAGAVCFCCLLEAFMKRRNQAP